jgi:hypothetical protein
LGLPQNFSGQDLIICHDPQIPPNGIIVLCIKAAANPRIAVRARTLGVAGGRTAAMLGTARRHSFAEFDKILSARGTRPICRTSCACPLLRIEPCLIDISRD